MNMYTAYVQQGELMFVATCLENGVVSQGKTPESAIKNLQEAVGAYLVVQKELGAKTKASSGFNFISTFDVQYA